MHVHNLQERMSGARNTLEISGKNHSQQVTTPRFLSAAVRRFCLCVLLRHNCETVCSRKGVAGMLGQQEKVGRADLTSSI